MIRFEVSAGTQWQGAPLARKRSAAGLDWADIRVSGYAPGGRASDSANASTYADATLRQLREQLAQVLPGG